MGELEDGLQSSQERAHQVLVSIRQIVRRVSEHSRYLSREVGLTVPQLLCLKAIGDLGEEHAEVTLARVAEQVQLSAATVSRIVDRLVRSGLVLRERGSQDRRRVCLSLTDEGTGRYVSLPTPLQEIFVERFSALTLDDQEGLLRALARITELMDATELDAAPILAPGADVKPSQEM